MSREPQRLDRTDVSDRTPRESLGGSCPASTTDLKSLLAALRPLGDSGAIERHAATCPSCFTRLGDLLLATAPDESDPIHRIVDGLNQSLYRLAKAVLKDVKAASAQGFCFDCVPGSADVAASEALDRLSALDEYCEGRIARSGEAAPLKRLIEESSATAKDPGLAESILKRSISIGGRHGLDAANLLGFLRYKEGDLDGAELLFNTVIERAPRDSYERETQAHAMNNLTGVCMGRSDLKSAILWCERSLMLKERLGLDASSNYLNLLLFWIDQSTTYGLERARHFLRIMLLQDGGREYLEQTLATEGYETSVAALRRHGLDREFPELTLPADRRQKTLGLQDGPRENEQSA